MATCEIVAAPLPELTRVSCSVLLDPVCSVPKFRLLGEPDKVPTGVLLTPVPETAMFAVRLYPL